MKAILTAILSTSTCIMLLAETGSYSYATNKYGGLSAENWRCVFSHSSQLSDFDYEGKTKPADFFKFLSRPPTTNDWQAYWTKQKTIDDNYADFFQKISVLPDQAIQVFADLLQDPSSTSNRVIQRCVLLRIGRGCDTNAQILAPLIRPYLFDDSICTQLAALDALHRLGPAPLSFTNDLAKCLNSSNHFVRAAAARNLSAFGARSCAYLSLIESLAQEEIYPNSRRVLVHAADTIKVEAQQCDPRNHRTPSAPVVRGR